MQITYSTGGSVGFSHSKLENQNLITVRSTKLLGFIEAFITSNKNQVEINLGAWKNAESNPFLNELKFISSEEFEGSFRSKFNNTNSVSLRRKFGPYSTGTSENLTYTYAFTKVEIDKGWDSQVNMLNSVIDKFMDTLGEFNQTRHLSETYVTEELELA